MKDYSEQKQLLYFLLENRIFMQSLSKEDLKHFIYCCKLSLKKLKRFT